MSDDELERLAKAALQIYPDGYPHHTASDYDKFYEAANPAAVLELIAENAKLREENAKFKFIGERLDKLAEENAALRAVADGGK